MYIQKIANADHPRRPRLSLRFGVGQAPFPASVAPLPRKELQRAVAEMID
jgi:hypothetical protein